MSTEKLETRWSMFIAPAGPEANCVKWCRAELLRAADRAANMHGESATNIAAEIRKLAS